MSQFEPQSVGLGPNGKGVMYGKEDYYQNWVQKNLLKHVLIWFMCFTNGEFSFKRAAEKSNINQMFGSLIYKSRFVELYLKYKTKMY